MDDADAGKRDKSSVNYRHASMWGERRCANCRYMLTGSRCRKVKGDIHPDDVCDLWEAKRAA